MPRIFMTVFALFIVFTMPAVGADFQKGMDAYDKGDFAAALVEWRALAKQGDAEAQSWLGLMYRLGQGVDKDDEKAAEWYRKSAEQGNSSGQIGLGKLYTMGRGVTQDKRVGIEWFRKAAEQGDPRGQQTLGLMYVIGSGTQKDFTKAHMWWSFAASKGNEAAKKNLDRVTTMMSPAKITEAQDLARECVKKKFKGC